MSNSLHSEEDGCKMRAMHFLRCLLVASFFLPDLAATDATATLRWHKPPQTAGVALQKTKLGAGLLGDGQSTQPIRLAP